MGTENGIGRALWLEERRKGIGGTDAAAILGVSKWMTPHDVWLAKLGRLSPKPDSEAMWWGRALEDTIALRYSQRTGRQTWKPDKFLQHPRHSCLIGSPDRLIVGDRRGLEIKMANAFIARSEFGDAGTDEIPQGYLVQCLHYLSLTDFDFWDVAALLGGSDFRIYIVEHDRALTASISDRLAGWWQRHIVEGVEPEIGDSEATRQWLRESFPQDMAPPLIADATATGWAERLRNARALLAGLEAEEAVAMNNLKALIGEAEGMKGDGWSATWKLARGATKVDWEGLARHLNTFAGMSDAEFAKMIAEHSTQQPGSRRFLFR